MKPQAFIVTATVIAIIVFTCVCSFINNCL